MKLRTLAVLTLCSLCGVAAVARDQPKDDSQLVQGAWDWEPAAKQSEAKPQVLLERVVIRGAKLTFHYKFDDKRFTSETEFKLDPKASPREIDFAPTEGANKGRTYLGLYKIEDGKLWICYRGPGSTRPKNFDDKSAGNDATVFIVLKRPPTT